MKFPFYTGKRPQPMKPGELRLPLQNNLNHPTTYLCEPGLQDAFNVALLLGKPLLLTGEPGVGKTRFAYSVAHEFGLESPLKFETKSNSRAQDLFYTYNTVGRFHAAQTNEGSQESVDYIDYNALGLAILLGHQKEEIQSWLPKNFKHPGEQQSVVLIDEIDKAPRDFPNDMLNELEEMYFKIPELGNRILKAHPEKRPIVILTSNSEKNLPDAFLRRCIYYHIQFPEHDRILEILDNHVGTQVQKSSPLLNEAVNFFYHLRQSGLVKKPSTAELLDWIRALMGTGIYFDRPLREQQECWKTTLFTLIKTSDDHQSIQSICENWLQSN